MAEIDDMDSGLLVIGNDMVFPKSTNVFRLVSDASYIITSIIMNVEKEFYKLILENNPTKLESLLTTTNPDIIIMIKEALNSIFNRIYLCIQNKNFPPHYKMLLDQIVEMSSYSTIHPYCLVEMLVGITLDAHVEIYREQLSTNTLDLYSKTVSTQLNLYFQSINLAEVLEHNCNDPGHWKECPHFEQKVFEIVIDKNISS